MKIEADIVNIGGYGFYVNADQGLYPRFTIELNRRIKQKRATNIVVTGEGGIGKTYFGDDIARGLNKRFDLDQVVFRYREFLEAVVFTGMGVPIVFDEPSYAMSKRDWYKELNQALVKTIESFRFKVHPLFIPIINKTLLDKTIRSYLLQYQVYVHNRGRAIVYNLYPSQRDDKTYQYFFCNLDYPLYDLHLCNKESCLDCHWLQNEDQPCQVFRARYERKKAATQDQRYESDLEEAKQRESQSMTLRQILVQLEPYLDQTLGKSGRIDISKLKIIYLKTTGTTLGHNKAYDLRTLIEFDYPEYAQ